MKRVVLTMQGGGRSAKLSLGTLEPAAGGGVSASPYFNYFSTHSSSGKICFTPFRRQDVVQVFISGSSMTRFPFWIRIHVFAHLCSSTE